MAANRATSTFLIESLNDDDSVHGILLQLPAPPQIDDDVMTALIDPLKDVDGNDPPPPMFRIVATAKGKQVADGNLQMDSKGNKTPTDKW